MADRQSSGGSSSSRVNRVLSVLLGAGLLANVAEAGSFEVVGNTGVSAQQMFLTTERTVQVVDKTEQNANLAFTVNGHIAWAAEYDLVTNTASPQDVRTNSFCAGGAVMGNGTWVNVGGNQAVVALGNSLPAGAAQGSGPYGDLDGGKVVRLLDYCDPNSPQVCDPQWREWDGMPTNRWYPSLEVLADGTVMVIGGETSGGYVGQGFQNVPNYEFIGNPAIEGTTYPMQFLIDTLPLNLFPATWLLPSGQLFMQAGNGAQLFNVATGVETRLPNIPGGQRVYPASAGITSLPQTPANNYALTAIFCGGLNQNLATDYDNTVNQVWNYQGVTNCQYMTPDVDPTWHGTDDLFQPSVMLNFINLPDGRVLGLNGCAQGTAGYGWQQTGMGQGYGRNPNLMPAGYYNHSAPPGQRWSQAGIQPSTIPRMYHSSALLLPDGSVFVAGSNPSADFIGTTSNGQNYNATDPYHTEYRAEKFYPDYYNAPRPLPSNLPASISYGGNPFTVTLPATNITTQADLDGVKMVIIRTGFSTHAINFGQRHVELPTSYTWNIDGSATFNVGQLPPNANVLAPGPALFFVVQHGVPSQGKFVMIGNGVVGTQPTAAQSVLPPNNLAYLQAQASRSAASASAAAAAATGGSAAGGSLSSNSSSKVPVGAVVGGIAGGVVALAALAGLSIFCINRRRRAAAERSRSAYANAAFARMPDMGYSTKLDSADSSQQDLPTLPYKRPVYPRQSSSTMSAYKESVAGMQRDSARLGLR